jgi:hypothetical protein
MPPFASELRRKGYVPLAKVSAKDLTLFQGASPELRARGDYPDWNRLLMLYGITRFDDRQVSDAADPTKIFSKVPMCRNNPRLLAEVIACIMLSADNTPSTASFGCSVYREMWLWLSRAGIGADDGLVLLEYSDLNIPIKEFPNMGKLIHKKALSTIIEAVKVVQALPTRLYLDRGVPFSLLLRVLANPSIVSPSAAAGQTVSSRAVTFDPSSARLSTAPPDLDLPFLAADASDFLEYKKDVEYRFQSRGVKQYLHELDQQQLMSSWSEAFCARLHASISKSTISYLNEQMKQEVSVARLWDGIKNCFDDAGQRLNRELKQWLTLFGLSVETVESFPAFLNVYKTSVSQLLAANSIALGDPQLMRALIMRSVTCDEFHSVMIELNKTQNVTHEDMVKSLEDHFRAYQHRADITGSATGTKSSRRGTKQDATPATGDAPAKKKLGYNVPSFPPALREIIGPYIFNQLRKWRNHCNKDGYTMADEEKRKEWVIYKSPPGGGDRGDNSGRKGRDGKRDNRGGKKNHHRNQDRRGRRGDRSSRSRSVSDDSRESGGEEEDDRSIDSRDRGSKKVRTDDGGRKSRRSRCSRSSSSDRRSSSRGGKDARILFGGRKRKS